MNNVAIITARGGSKRIPGKNIKNFLGKPIIIYSIEAALKSELFSEVMVSTDDEEIVKIAVAAGAKVPFIRSMENSNDFATTADVLLEVLNDYKIKHQIEFEYACCIYPTAPFVTADKLKEAYKVLLGEQLDTVFPVTRFSASILRSYRSKDGKLSLFWPEHKNARSQDLEPVYFDSGQFYFFDIKKFYKSKSLITDNTSGIEVLETEVQDIDTEDDWKLAELKYLYTFKKEAFNSLLK